MHAICEQPAISPLNRKGGADLATRCSVQFTLNESTGTVVVENVQEESVQAVAEFRSQIFRVVMVVLLLVLIVAAWYMYGVHVRHMEYQTNADWLADFYKHNAPEVSERPSQLCNCLSVYVFVNCIPPSMPVYRN